MGRHFTHDIIACTDCPRRGEPCGPGLDLTLRLQEAAGATGAFAPDFEMTGTICVTGCGRPCHLAFRITPASTHVLGDVDPGADVRWRGHPVGSHARIVTART